MTETGQDFESFLQADFWLRFKSEFGWEAQRLREPDGSPGPGVLHRRLPLGNHLSYIPHAPLSIPDPDHFGDYLAQLAANNPTLVRFDLPWAPGAESAARDLGLRPAGVTVQPPSTVVIDLDRDEDSLLKAMKSKTRYNVRLAAKRGVGVRIADLSELPRWYRLYQETSRRDRIAIHSEAYYRRLFEILRTIDGSDGATGSSGGAVKSGGPAGNSGGAGSLEVTRSPGSPRLLLYLAEHDGDLLAGNIVLEWAGTATYLYGASSGLRRELMAPYLLQWEAMRQAMARGCARYDLFGIPPTPDPKHPMHGLYRFKTGFGGGILHRLGAWDYPYAPVRYAVYRAAEGVRDYYYKVIRKRGR